MVSLSAHPHKLHNVLPEQGFGTPLACHLRGWIWPVRRAESGAILKREESVHMDHQERIGWIDNAKAIGMFLIVWGHTSGIDPDVEARIYAFHVPLFFFLAGTLVRPAHLSDGLAEWTRRNLRRLVVPYAFFWGLSYGFWLLQAILTNPASLAGAARWTAPLAGLLYGTGEALEVNVTLWFFPALFCTAMLFWGVWRIRGRWCKASALAGCGLIGPALFGFSGVRLPWSLEPALVAVVFYACGFVFARGFQTPFGNKPVIRWSAAVVFAAVVIVVVRWNGRADMNSMQLGNLALFYIGAFCGIAVVVLVASSLPANRLCTAVARTTIVIFPMHLLAFRVFTGIAVFGFGVDKSFKDGSLGWSLLYTAAAMALSYAFAIVLRRWVPWAIGSSRPGVSNMRLDAARPEAIAVRLPSAGALKSRGGSARGAW